MRHSFAAISAASAAAVMATDALAQQDEVTVRGDSAGNWTSRADERDSARELTDAASLVEPLPGVYVRRFGGDDSFTTLSVRGSSSNEVTVILAGVPLTGGADPTLDLATLPLWPGAVARVQRSFAPAALGPGSLGGTLVIDPPRATAPPATDVWAAVGSFGEARLRVGNVCDLGAGARVVTALSGSRSDGDFTYFNPGLSTPGHDAYSTFGNAGHAAANGLTSLALPVRWGPSSEGALTVTALAQARRQELPGTVLGPTPFARLESDRELASAEMTGGTGSGAWSARGWARRDGLHLRDAPGSAALGPTSADQSIVAVGGSLGWRGRPLSDATVEAHLDGSGERFAPGDYVGGPSPPSATRASVGAAVDADWRPTPRLAVAASGRVDGWADAATDGTSDHELRPTGHLGIEAPLGGLTLAAHGGATGRPPSFVERYGDRGAFIGDPDLRPESAWTVDAGGRFSRRFESVKVTSELVTFATWADDLITFVPTGAYGRAKATNIGRARMLGVEFDVRAQAGPVELRGSYTGLATENDASCTAIVGPCQRPPLPARPANDVVADAIVHDGPVTVRAGVDAVSGMFADSAGSIAVPARLLASAGGRVDLGRGVRLALDLRNLFDVRTGVYQGALGPVREPVGDYYEYPLPGRSVLVSARFSEQPEER